MDKIKELLKKCNLSDEAAQKICESLDRYATTLKQQYDEEFRGRLKEAKKVCLDETNAHKAELARRLQVFLEAKSAAIEEQIARQAANKKAEAVARLEKIQGLLEGIEPSGQSSSELQAEVAKLKRVAEHLVEERNKAIEKARKMQAISERVLNRNRELTKSLTEGRTTTRKPVNTPRVPAKRGVASRKTTQRTLAENVDRQPRPPVQRPKSLGALRTPEDIANAID